MAAATGRHGACTLPRSLWTPLSQLVSSQRCNEFIVTRPRYGVNPTSRRRMDRGGTAWGSCIWNTGHHYGDWLALDAGDGSYTGASRKNFIATAFYAHSAQLLAQAMDALDMDGAAYHV